MIHKKTRPRPRPRSRSYLIINDIVHCFPDTDSLCHVSRLAESDVETPSHDKILAKATREINSILDQVRKTNKNKEREMEIIDTPKGLFLVWTLCGVAINPKNDDADIIEVLKLK